MTPRAAERPNDLVILAPVFNDWPSVRLLLPRLDAELAANRLRARVVLVNDGSFIPPPQSLVDVELKAVTQLRILSLRRNLGHQRALAVGLAFVHAQMPCAAVVVMDADGEDDPADVPRLVAELRGRNDQEIVFAQRIRRSEGIVFTLLYRLYRTVHRMLTGISVQVGNFSVVPFGLLDRLVVVSDLWNHYAAAVFQSRLPYRMVPTQRGERLSGQSSMDLVSLVGHGLSAIAVFADRVGVRILIAAIAMLAATVLALGIVFGRSIISHVPPAPWVIVAAVVSLVIVVQTIATASLFVLQVLFARGGATFIPARDYQFFVDSDDLIAARAERVV
jgi:hypothetical protein